MADKLINESKAIQMLIQELNKLGDDDSRKRVLDYLYNAYSIPLTKDKTINDSNQHNDTSGDNFDKNPSTLWKNKQPENNYEKFTLVAYYLEVIKGKEEYSRVELETCWRIDFRQTLPGKQVVTNTLDHTVRTYQYLLTGSKKGLYRLGTRGSDLVVGLPNPDESLKGHAKKSKNKIKKISKPKKTS